MSNSNYNIPINLITDITELINSADHIEELGSFLEIALEKVCRTDYNVFYLLNSRGDKLNLIFAKNFTENDKKEAEKSAMNRHPGKVVRSKQKIIINDTTKEKISITGKRSFEVLSRLFIPLIISDKCVGTLGIANTEKNTFSDDHVQLLSFIGNLTCIKYGELKRKKELKERNKYFAKIIDNALDAHLIMNRKGKVTYWNKKAEELFGWTLKEALGASMASLIIPDHYKQSHKTGFQTFLKTGKKKVIGQRIEIEAVTKSKKIIPIELIVTDIQVDNEVFFSAFIQDISLKVKERKAIEIFNKKLKIEVDHQTKEIKELSLFPEHNPNPVLEVDYNHNILYANPAAKKIFKDKKLSEKEPLCKIVEDKLSVDNSSIIEIPEEIIFLGRRYNVKVYNNRESEKCRLYFNDLTELKQIQQKVIEQRDSIIESLKYAQNIQKSILPKPRVFKDYFEDYFVFYKPKDIVSGDFYWTKSLENDFLFAMCDCTGHGVPGAFMSIIGNNALNRIIKEHKSINIQLMMSELNDYYYKSRIESNDSVMDSMDIILLHFNRNTKKLYFSGCLQQFYIIRNNNLSIHKTQIKPLGLETSKDQFIAEEVQLMQGDRLYLFTDGYADQFGGKKSKKFKYPGFRKLLIDNNHDKMVEQKIKLISTLESWRNSHSVRHEQIDDISVIGLKL